MRPSNELMAFSMDILLFSTIWWPVAMNIQWLLGTFHRLWPSIFRWAIA